MQERQQAEAVRLQQTSEINRLREELNAVRPLLQGSAFQNGSLQDRSRSGTVDSITISGSNSVGNSSGTGWFSFFGYLFGSSGDTQPKSGMSAVLKL